jgi:putative endonuclease
VRRSFSEGVLICYNSIYKLRHSINPDPNTMKHVYLIQSISHPDRRYTGITTDPNARLTANNQGKSKHTSKYRPWKLVTAISFTDDPKAHAFELYLKTGSGREFATSASGSLFLLELY